MKFKALLTALLLGLGVQGAYSVPAKPGLRTFTQPDGTVITAELRGDEYFHFYETSQGELLLRSEDGFLRRAAVAENGSLQAIDLPGKEMSESERRIVLDKIVSESAGIRLQRNPMKKNAPGEIKRDFPTTGTVKGLIIMAEFEDVKFLDKSTRDYFDKKVNSSNYSGSETIGSVNDYFREQSGGIFTPEFDVVGPVTLPHRRGHYGETENLVDFFRDVCIAADEECDVDFSDYDINNDGFVDFVFVIFAGHGEAQGGSYDCIWPAMMDLSNYVYDYFDGMNLKQAACSCELREGSGEIWDGVGTICHEFSHILGLADIYDSRYSGGNGMGHYDLMDVGPYNSDGKMPAGYTAMDKFTLGWLTPNVLSESSQDITLNPIITTNESYFIVNPENENEYYTLENRQPIGFDAGLPGHGLVISYVHYDPQHWRRNTVNSPSVAGYEHVIMMPADGNWAQTPASESADPFPGVNNVTAFPSESTPNPVWRTTGSPAEISITDIREDENGVITFNFNSLAGVKDVAGSTPLISGGKGMITAPEDAVVFSAAGFRCEKENLAPGIYIVVSDGKAVKVAVR